MLYLSYSYLTFVINKQMQELGGQNNYIMKDYLFDQEQYNYAIDRKSSLTELSLIENPRKLKWVLQKMYETAPHMIELLQL